MRSLFVLIPIVACLNVACLSTAAHAADDAAFDSRLKALDEKVSKVQDYSANFQQQKFTALLRKPLVSTGTVKVLGPVVRWDTQKPEPAVLHADGKEFKLYYPNQKLLEVYPIDQRMSDMVASPLPRLEALRKSFAFEALAPADMKSDAGELADGKDRLALKLTPTSDELKKHLREVRVLLDTDKAFMLCVVTVDAEGDRTIIRFSDVRLNTGVKPAEVALNVPADVKVSRPLDAVGGK